MSTFPNADENVLSIIEESDWGVIPTTPVWKEARITGENLKAELSKNQSAELNPNADITNIFPTKGGAGGDVNLELSGDNFFDLLLEHSLRSAFDAFGVMKASTLNKSLSAEKRIKVDASYFYKRYTGLRVNSLAVDLAADSESAITGTVSFMGRSEVNDTVIETGATYAPASTQLPFYMPEVRNLKITGSDITGNRCFRTFSFTINNNVREQQGKCTDVVVYPDLNAKGIAYGKREVTIDLALYFTDLKFSEAFQNNTFFELEYIISNGTQGYKLTFHKVMLREEEAPTEGTNSDVIENMSGQALYDTTAGTVLTIEKIGSLAASAGIKFTGTGAQAGTYYTDGTQEGGQNVYYSLDGLYGLWYDGVNYSITTVADVGTGATEYFYIAGTTPTGAFTVGVDGTGTLTGAAYDPTA